MYRSDVSAASTILTLLILFLVGVPVSAVDNRIWTDADSEPCDLCWREKASPDCRSSVIFSTAMYYRASAVNVRSGKGGGLFVFDFGVMRNLDRQNALGGLLWASGDDDGSRYGLGIRYRRWFNPRVCADLTAGMLFAGVDNYQRPNFPGFVSEASIAVYGLLSLDARFELYRYEPDNVVVLSPNSVDTRGTARALYLGATGRSWGAFVIPVAVAVLVAITLDDMTIE